MKVGWISPKHKSLVCGRTVPQRYMSCCRCYSFCSSSHIYTPLWCCVCVFVLSLSPTTHTPCTLTHTLTLTHSHTTIYLRLTSHVFPIVTPLLKNSRSSFRGSIHNWSLKETLGVDWNLRFALYKVKREGLQLGTFFLRSKIPLFTLTVFVVGSGWNMKPVLNSSDSKFPWHLLSYLTNPSFSSIYQTAPPSHTCVALAL